ncbi:unnamed protein product [Rotaria sordida]|nr:unnamed protein product [Rotaria sordida]CAF3948847.1 unnamed protein product [Rotaria sordida]CAF3949919.1 unnamed protein product [Rotaria sordida]
MNTTLFIELEILIKNSTAPTNESWFIPFDLIITVTATFAIILALFFLFIIVIDKTCHTVPMILVANSCLSGLILACTTLSTSIFTLENDFKQVQYEDSLCAFRSYLGYVSSAVFNFSFLLQTLYRYVIVVYPTRLFWQSVRFQSLLICLTWFFAILCPILFIIKNEIIYDVDGQICHIPYRLSFSIIYGALINYIIPISITMLFYLKLVRHVYGMSKRITPANRLVRAQNELKMVQRIVTLIIILITLGVPFVVFITMSLFTNPPKYHTRIGYVFFNVSLALVMITLFQFTDPLKATAKKLINIRPNNITS